jgi:HEAT repeat protein
MVYQSLKAICFTSALLLYTYASGAWARTCSDQEIVVQLEQLSRGGSFEELAVDALSECDSAAIPKLAQKVRQVQSPMIQRGIIRVLSNMGEVSINALSQLLNDQTINQATREAIVVALIKISQDHSDQAKDISVALLSRLLDKNEAEQIRVAAAFSLGRDLASKADFSIPGLISILKDRQEPEEIRYWSAVALSSIAPQDKTTVGVIVEVLQNRQESWSIRLGMLRILSKMGMAATDSIPDLVEILQDDTFYETLEGQNFIDEVLRSLVAISEATQAQADNKDLERFKSDLEIALSTIQEKFKPNLEDLRPQTGWESPEFQRSTFIQKQVDSIIYILGSISDDQLLENNRIKNFLQNNSSFTISFSTALGAVIIYLLIFRYRARWLLLLPDKVSIPWIKVELPIAVMCWLKYRPKVLDSWVEFHIESVRSEFHKKDTVKDRKVHIPLPVETSQSPYPIELSPKELKSHFKQPINNLLIVGEGGIGKTSLACQIGTWAIAYDVEQRLCPHYMLPVLIEQDFDVEAVAAQHPLVVRVQAELRRLTQDFFQPPYELVESLLRHRRLLVIMDHLSEMSDSTRDKFQPEQANFPANALIVTSRLDESLGRVNKTVLSPLRIGGNQLLGFAIPYLKRKAKEHPSLSRLSDEQKSGLCRGLTRMVDGRDVSRLT